MKNIRLMLMDKSEIIVPYSNVKDLVTTYSFVRDKCYEFKLFIKASEEEIEIIKKCTAQYVAFEYNDDVDIEAIKVPFKPMNGVNTNEKVWDTGDGWIGIQFKNNKETK